MDRHFADFRIKDKQNILKSVYTVATPDVFIGLLAVGSILSGLNRVSISAVWWAEMGHTKLFSRGL